MARTLNGLSCLVYGTGLSSEHPGKAERVGLRDRLQELGVDARFAEDILAGKQIPNGDFLRSQLIEATPFDLIIALQPPNTLTDAPTLRGELHDLSWAQNLFPRVAVLRPLVHSPNAPYYAFDAVVSRFIDDHVFSYEMANFTLVHFMDLLTPWLEEVLFRKELGLWPDPSPPMQAWLQGVTY